MSGDSEEDYLLLPVWQAFAELFLDTETQPHTYDWVVRTLKGSGLPVDELRRILVEEVGPRFIFNLLDIAGDWAGWTDETVINLMARPKDNLTFEEQRFLRTIVTREWTILAPRLES